MQSYLCSLFCFLLVLLSLPAWANSQDATLVKVGVYQNPPKVFLDQTDLPSGIFIDLIKAVAQAENWQLEFVPGTWQEGLSRLKAAEIDLMPDVAYTKQREKLYLFNAEPVLSDWFQVYARANLNILSILDLEKRKVAVLENSVQQDFFLRMIDESAFSSEVIGLPDYESAFAMVDSSQIDAAIVNRFYGKMKSREYKNIKETGIIFNPTRLHFVTQKNSKPQIMQAIDRHLRIWKGNTTSVYYKTLEKWTGESPAVVFPKYILAAVIILASAFSLALVFVGLLRWRVRVQTSELRTKSEALQQALDELQKASEKLKERERLHVLGQMASGISHNFNNILTPILGFSEILLTNPALFNNPEQTKRYLGMIQAAAQDGAAIVNRMKMFYKAQHGQGEAQPIDLGELVKSTVELTLPLWKTQKQAEGIWIEIQTELEPVSKVLGQAVQLREVLVNLLINAIDAMPKGGKICISLRDAEGLVQLGVKDEGEGMSEAVLAQCLRPFYTTKGETGTGLGLATATDILEKHGGRLEIQSRPGHGTEVLLLFPPCFDKGQSAELAELTPTKPLHLLVLDDEPQALEALTSLLLAEGHTIEKISDPQMAIAKAEGGAFDAVIMDYAMPGLSGFELSTLLSKRLPDLPIIVMSGSYLEAQQEEALRQIGVVAILSKPVKISELRRIFSAQFYQTQV